ncbi:non-canonical purine NTP pyrophosphatase [Roseibium denhamense]|uniref:XTP/dITP diphosphohydrolase n=1 Tax=Roseibium denhamense TaxID=76305 RepID=A0ABY1P1T6_9HYPH|nr:non-canonical purine NTP pyrophosphatase [Roseibium denhamense]MTI07547.1 non-canonical purine NTP pyrophosphatase [Roseibium denhamense]SMP23834.1 XTP/dITP diphosphohydrolase [Roseibium denhamense]
MNSIAQASKGVLADTLTVAGSLVVASHNKNKIRAFKEALSGCPVPVLTAADFKLTSPEENGTTVLENALIKARDVAAQSGQAAISDDSGFCISELDDLPGAAALDWAGPDGNYDVAIERIGTLIGQKNLQTGSARFVTCIAIALPDGTAIAEEGATHGRLVWPPKGPTEGYLSVFALPGETMTVAEQLADVDLAQTHELPAYRHRKATIEKLMARLSFQDC